MPIYLHDIFPVLVVEDDPVARRFLEEYLADVAEITTTESGKAGIDLFASALTDDPFALICLDTYLPDISGREVLTSVRRIEKEKHVPEDERVAILMTTAASDIKDVLKAMHLGCDGYVTKPFTKEQLFTELNKLGFALQWE